MVGRHERGGRHARDLGGDLSAQQTALLRDYQRIGFELARLSLQSAQTDGSVDQDRASKIGTLVGQRRSTLLAVGLERRTRELDLHDYLASRAQYTTSATNGHDPDPQAADAEILPEKGPNPCAMDNGSEIP